MLNSNQAGNSPSVYFVDRCHPSRGPSPLRRLGLDDFFDDFVDYLDRADAGFIVSEDGKDEPLVSVVFAVAAEGPGAADVAGFGHDAVSELGFGEASSPFEGAFIGAGEGIAEYFAAVMV